MGTGACICGAELCSSCWLKDDDPDESDLSIIEEGWLPTVISSMADCARVVWRIEPSEGCWSKEERGRIQCIRGRRDNKGKMERCSGIT